MLACSVRQLGDRLKDAVVVIMEGLQWLDGVCARKEIFTSTAYLSLQLNLPADALVQQYCRTLYVEYLDMYNIDCIVAMCVPG